MKIKFFLLIIFILLCVLVCIFASIRNNELFDIDHIKLCDIRFLTIPRSKMNKCIAYPSPPDVSFRNALSNTKYSNIKSLLSWSIIFDCKYIFYYLIDNGVDVNSVCHYGNIFGATKSSYDIDTHLNSFTPLYYAVLLNRVEYIGPLLNASANFEYLGGHFDDESNTLVSTKTYFDIAYNKQNFEAFCELYKHLILQKKIENIKISVMDILDNDYDFKLSFFMKCKGIPY